tara:strand:- start:252 stop:455 length:204 start_codon:yes stop_codon:yes gene_type:complete
VEEKSITKRFYNFRPSEFRFLQKFVCKKIKREACPEIYRENDFVKNRIPYLCLEKIVEKMTGRVFIT